MVLQKEQLALKYDIWFCGETIQLVKNVGKLLKMELNWKYTIEPIQSSVL